MHVGTNDVRDVSVDRIIALIKSNITWTKMCRRVKVFDREPICLKCEKKEHQRSAFLLNLNDSWTHMYLQKKQKPKEGADNALGWVSVYRIHQAMKVHQGDPMNFLAVKSPRVTDH